AASCRRCPSGGPWRREPPTRPAPSWAGPSAPVSAPPGLSAAWVPFLSPWFSALVDRFAAALTDPQLAPVGERLDPAARRLVAPAADHQHVGERQRALALD